MPSNKSNEPAVMATEFRDVTPEEIAHYRQFGWVHLRRFVPAAKVAELLAIAKSHMGEDGAATATPSAFAFFNTHVTHGANDPAFAPLLARFGKAAVALRALRSAAGTRSYVDHFAVKVPAARADGHGKSDWHQDFMAQARDRSGGMTFWTALTDMKPERGTMEFLNGSHHYGVMGDYRSFGTGSLLDEFPDLLEKCPSSGQLTLAAGDVTVHSDLCVHQAGPNVSDGARWAYIAFTCPSDARWTGAPAVAFDTTGLKPLDLLPDSHCPIIA